VQLNCRGCSSELHAFWDGVVGKSMSPKSAMSFGTKLPPPDATQAAKSEEKDWIAESFQAAQQHVYVPPIGAGDGPFVLTVKYKSDAKALAEERIALGGARLANLLNHELK